VLVSGRAFNGGFEGGYLSGGFTKSDILNL